MTQPLILESELTCPMCGNCSMEEMPTNACIYFHECSACGALLSPKSGDCCVFCSYGSVACPPIQSQSGCCART
ncbi:MAG: GDCCVxC domain-containing (seleno)protein [Arenimonas sp.]